MKYTARYFWWTCVDLYHEDFLGEILCLKNSKLSNKGFPFLCQEPSESIESTSSKFQAFVKSK